MDDSVCRVCKCTDNAACVDDALGPCWWVAEDLCSHCERRIRDLKRFDTADRIAAAIGVTRTAVYNWAQKRPTELRTKKKSGHLLFHARDCMTIHASPRRPGRKTKS